MGELSNDGRVANAVAGFSSNRFGVADSFVTMPFRFADDFLVNHHISANGHGSRSFHEVG